jgi:uncharacterized membrane protein
MMLIHIVAGFVSLASGFTALFATKGSTLHRRAGMLFVVSMLVMSGTGALIAAFVRPNAGSAVAGTITFYMVCTAVMTVRFRPAEVRAWIAGLSGVAFVTSGLAFAAGLAAANHPHGHLEGIPSPPLFLFSAVALLGATGDVRLLIRGHIEGAQRIARHLWRMTYAMFVATASAFLGQAKFFPEPIRKSGLLAIPVLIVVVMLFWSLWRTLRRRRLAVATS